MRRSEKGKLLICVVETQRCLAVSLEVRPDNYRLSNLRANEEYCVIPANRKRPQHYRRLKCCHCSENSQTNVVVTAVIRVHRLPDA